MPSETNTAANVSDLPAQDDPLAGCWGVTINDWIRIAGSSRSATYRFIRTGALDARKIGGKTLITVESARRFLRDLPPATAGSRSDRTGA